MWLWLLSSRRRCHTAQPHVATRTDVATEQAGLQEAVVSPGGQLSHQWPHRACGQVSPEPWRAGWGGGVGGSPGLQVWGGLLRHIHTHTPVLCWVTIPAMEKVSSKRRGGVGRGLGATAGVGGGLGAAPLPKRRSQEPGSGRKPALCSAHGHPPHSPSWGARQHQDPWKHL